MKTGESTEIRPAGLRSAPLDHATQVPPGKDMNMEVGHLLVRVGAVVGKEAVTALNHAEVPGDGADGAEKTRNLRVRGVLGEIIHGHVGPFGNDQHMDGGLGIDVLEGEHGIVLVDLVAGNIASQDFGENIFRIISHRYSLASFSSIPEVPARLSSSAKTSSGLIPCSAHKIIR